MNPMTNLNQIAMDFFAHKAFPVHARARATDPMTSIDAAVNAEKFAGSHAGRIMAVLKHGPLSAPGIGLLSGLTVVQIDRRTKELQAKGLIRTTGEVMLGCRVWQVASAKH